MKISDIHKPNISDQFKLNIVDKYKVNLDKTFAKKKLEEHTKKKYKRLPLDAQSQNTYVISKKNKLPPNTLNDYFPKKK